MGVSVTRLPLYAAGLAVIAGAAVAGCSASSSSAAGAASPAAAAQVSPLEAVQLAARTADRVNSFTGTMDMHVTVKPGAAGTTGTAGETRMTATFAEQVHPSLLARVDIGSLTSGGSSLPGGIAEIVTPSALYLKSAALNQALHVTKPWLVLSFSDISKSTGVNLTQLLNQATANSPLTQSKMFAGATSVRRMGTGSIDGVPVTEYAGTVPMDKALSNLSGSSKSQLEQQVAAAGLTTEKFTVWIDGQHLTRKAFITVDGKSLTESITMSVTSINQPVNVALPPASQTAPLPGNLS